MTELVTFEERRVALAFSDYLRTLGIANRLENQSDRFAVMLQDEQALPRAREELEAFIQNPGADKYWQASWRSGQVQRDTVYNRPDGSWLAGFLSRSGPFTMAVAGICVLVYLGFQWNADAAFSWLHFPDALSLQAIGHEWWRLLTPAVMHFYFIHLLFNLMWWWDLGGLVERSQSSAQLLGVTLVIALVSNVAQFFDYGIHFLGLSAVVYGLLGYVWLYPKANPAVGFRLRREVVWFMLGWLVLGYSGLLDNVIGKVSNTGHSVGLVTGCVLGLAFGFLNRGNGGKTLAGKE